MGRLLGTYLTLILTNLEAIRKSKRFISSDLNRAFPGSKKGKLEEQIAYYLTPTLKKQDLVIDLHATRSDFTNVGIVTKFSTKIMEVARVAKLSKIICIDTRKFGKGALISVCRDAISLEYGRRFLAQKRGVPFGDVARILRHVGVMEKKQKHKNGRKSTIGVFNLEGVFSVPEDFRRGRKNYSEFTLIRRGEIVGYAGGKKIVAPHSFHPAFMGKGKYKGVFALMLKKRVL